MRASQVITQTLFLRCRLCTSCCRLRFSTLQQACVRETWTPPPHAMLTDRRKLLATFSTCVVFVAAICFLSAPSAPSESLLDPDDPQFRLSPPSSGEYVAAPSLHYIFVTFGQVLQRVGPCQ